MAPVRNNQKKGAASLTKLHRIFTKVLLIAAALFMLGAAAVYAVLEYEGTQAQMRAEKLLIAATEDSIHVLAENPAHDEQVEATTKPRVLGDLTDYPVIAKITIPKLAIELPVIEECTPEALEVSVCRFVGPYEPGEAGNLVITGHNYRSGAHFGRLDEVSVGDSVVLMDIWGDEFFYEVSEMLTITPDEAEALGVTNAARSLDLLTCTNSANARLLVRCVAVDK